MRKLLYKAYKGWYQFRPPRLTVGVRALVVDDANRVCLVRHTYRDGWFLPGGGVKVGESLVDAMSRELKEETGVVLPETPRRVLGVYSSFAEHKSDHIVVFVLDEWELTSARSAEIAEVAFFSPEELPEGTSAATTRRIKEFITGVPPGHRW
ncbi:MAG: NUDIX domain-containing protein [Actinomycetia bacterium]|nr:NUDIX domain-containing protein [Actinomycetes bacterium]MCP4958825.1 NUDIX domain-containing protein [Actinomycetes bacterium]